MSVIYNIGIGGTASKNKIDKVEIWGKRWFQKSYGNTYHKVRVYVNDKLIGTSPIVYGYGDSYLQTGKEILMKSGYFPIALKNTNDLSSFFRKKKIEFIYYANDVKRERDLKNF
jgi:hypothetical protein